MRRLGWLAWLAVAMVWVGCPKKKQPEAVPVADAGPAQVTEKEPNDRLEQAQALADSTIVTASLNAEPNRGDEDWYALVAASPRLVDVTVGGIPGTDVVLEVYDTDHNRLASVNSEGEGKPERLPNLGVRGKLLLKISATKKGTGGAYTLTALFHDALPGFELEPNDRAADSNELKLGEAVPDGWRVSGYVGHSGDADWYRVDLQGETTDAPAHAAEDAGTRAVGLPRPAPAPIVPQDPDSDDLPAVPPGPMAAGAAPLDAGAPQEVPKMALRVDLSPVAGVKLEVQILSEAQAVLFGSKGKENEALSFRNVGVRATDKMIFVVIKSAWSGTGKEAKRGYNADKPYTLTVTKEAAGANAEYEPNDDFTKATPLPLDGFREGFIASKSDVDYYVLRSAQPVTVRAQLSGVDRLDLVLSAVRPNPDKPNAPEQVLIKANDGAIKEPEVLNNVSCQGDCYFKVEGALKKVDGKWLREYENPDQAYRLSITAVADDGTQEREPNDTVDTANVLPLGKPVRGTIHPKKDSDFYKVDLSARPVKTPLKATVTGILKVDIALYLWRVTDSGKELVQTSDKAKGEQPEVVNYAAEPGVYLFEVRDSKNRESNFQDAYQLIVVESE